MMSGHLGGRLSILASFLCLSCCDQAVKLGIDPPAQSPLTSSSPRVAPKAPVQPQAVQQAKTVRVYIAGESIERRNRFVAPPFQANGALNPRGSEKERNDDDEYGWMIPFQDRLKIRNPKLQIQWVGTETWLGGDDNPYDGTYPAQGAGATSAISGTSIESWLEQREKELASKRHCYDVAFAARGGNDFGNDDDENYRQMLGRLVSALLKGSKCNQSPIVYVTAHMPDDQRDSKAPASKAYVEQQVHRFVRRSQEFVAQFRASQPASKLRFVDMYSPFIENRRTTAFPNEIWSKDGVPDYAKIGRLNDRMHPRRLSSIFAGEIVADSIDLNEWYALP